jgi:hypothetical protein
MNIIDVHMDQLSKYFWDVHFILLWRIWPFSTKRLGKHRLKAEIATEAEVHLLITFRYNKQQTKT